RIVLNRYAPVGVVIDETSTVLQFRGRTSAYLEPAPGMASLDLLRMLREGLLTEVRSAIMKARTENIEVTCESIPLAEVDGVRSVKLEVVPFRVPPSGVRFYLVLFEDLESQQPARPPSLPPETSISAPSTAGTQVAQLQQELGSLREYLQSVIEEQESTNEELKS